MREFFGKRQGCALKSTLRACPNTGGVREGEREHLWDVWLGDTRLDNAQRGVEGLGHRGLGSIHVRSIWLRDIRALNIRVEDIGLLNIGLRHVGLRHPRLLRVRAGHARWLRTATTV